MPDYKEVYFMMMRETEKAINILIEAQKQCEEMIINAEEPKVSLLKKSGLEKSQDS